MTTCPSSTSACYTQQCSEQSSQYQEHLNIAPAPQSPAKARHTRGPPNPDADGRPSSQSPSSEREPQQSRSRASDKRKATATKPTRKRKAQKVQDDLSSAVHNYLAETDPSLWSLEHLKCTIGTKFPAKQKWYFVAELEEISRVSPSSEEGLAARRLLNKLKPRKDFSTPVATFSISSGASSANTVIYAQHSTINTSAANPSTPAASSRGSTTRHPQGSGNASGSNTTSTSAEASGRATPPQGNSPTLFGSPSSSESSKIDYGPYDIEYFLDIYPSLQTKFTLTTERRETTLEDLLYAYLQDPANASLVKEGNLLLQAGFIDIVSRPAGLLSPREYEIVKAVIKSEEDHFIANCVRRCFEACITWEGFVDARERFRCEKCRLDPLFQQAISAVLFTAHFLLNTPLPSSLPLEGTFDILWAPIIDHAFISPFGFLHRKEKTSPLSPHKFDGLYIGGRVEPQEWLVIEVARVSGPGLKQSADRQKLIEHCMRILHYRRWYLSMRTNLRGKDLGGWLGRFPMWGVLCQGFDIEIVRLVWLTRGVGIVTTFASRFPEHVSRLDSLYRVLEEVHYAAASVKNCVKEWDALHGQMAGNRLT